MEAEEWARSQLAVTQLTPFRSRPWADVWRVSTDDGTWWLKVNGAATTYEPRLLAQLAELDSDLVPECLVHPWQPWALIVDAGGPVAARDPVPGLDEQVEFWCVLLGGYAELQQQFGAGSRPDTGMPDFSPDRLLERFDEVLGDEVWFNRAVAPQLTVDQMLRIRRARPLLSEAVDRLRDGRPATVQHDDLHQNNVLVPPAGPLAGRIIDWGDAVRAHPFGTMLVTLRSLADGWAVPPDDRRLRRVRDAYLEPWRTRGESVAELVSELDLVVRTAGLTRAAGWIRALGTPDAGMALDMADGPSTWMLRVADALGAARTAGPAR